MAAELQVRRYEEKYLLSPAQAAVLESLLDGVLPRDRYSAEGAYFIRSLYFDTPGNADYQDKLLGVSERKKLRLRLYDLRAAQLKLEIKAKQARTSHKQSALLDRDAAQALIAGDAAPLLAGGPASRAAYALLQGGEPHPGGPHRLRADGLGLPGGADPHHAGSPCAGLQEHVAVRSGCAHGGGAGPQNGPGDQI